MKFKVGDRVKVRKDLKNDTFYGGNRVNEEMFMHRGQILTIRAIDGKNYLMEEDNWYWTDEMFEDREEYNYEDLKKSPIGTKTTFENGEVLVKDDDGNYSNKKRWRDDSDLKELKDRVNTLGKIIKIEEPTYQTVYEVKQEILDEAEKRYLKGVIRPFKDKVKYIEKCKSVIHKDDSYICIQMKNNISTALPYFESKTMYKNMENDKEYTLEELGL